MQLVGGVREGRLCASKNVKHSSIEGSLFHLLQETESDDHLHPNVLITSQKVDSSQVDRHASGVAQKQSFVSPQQQVDICRGGGMGTTEMTAAEEEYQSSNKEENAQMSAGKTSNHHSPDAVQHPPQHASPSQPNGQNASLCNPEEHYREATQRPEAEQDERRAVVGKSRAPQYASGLPPAGTDDSSHVAQQGETRKKLQFTDIASVSDMPIQCFTNKGMAYVQLYAEIEPYVDRHA